MASRQAGRQAGRGQKASISCPTREGKI